MPIGIKGNLISELHINIFDAKYPPFGLLNIVITGPLPLGRAAGTMDPAAPRPCAATRGTTILAEDLFYSMPLRRKALKSASEEYAAILDVVGRYAVYRSGAAISVKRVGEARPDLHTQTGANRQETIKSVYGSAVAKNLLPLAFTKGQGREEGQQTDLQAGQAESASAGDCGSLRCSVEGFVTGADYAGRKTQLVLFINGRSVEFAPLKRCLEATYAALLPKAAKPFAFLAVTMPSHEVDVNVHPTKREVAFLHQEELIEAVRAAVEEVLLASNAQRTFKQALLPGVAPPLPPIEVEPAPAPGYYRPDKLVRTDARAQTLHAFLGSQPHPQPQQQHRVADSEPAELASVPDMRCEIAQDGPPGGEGLAAVPKRRRGAPAAALPVGDAAFLPTPMEIAATAAAAAAAAAPEARNTLQEENQNGDQLVPAARPPSGGAGVPTQTLQRPVRHRLNPSHAAGVASVERLLASAERAPHAGLAEVLRSPTFVGMADSTRALLQCGTRLYLADMAPVTRDMFYQQALRRFGCAPLIALSPAVPVRDLALVALEAEEAAGRWRDSREGGTKEEVASLLAELVARKSDLLADCFSVVVDEEGRLAALPQLIEQYHPLQQYLPAFVLALGQSVDWRDEEACFGAVAQALGELYSLKPIENEDWESAGSPRGGEGGGCAERGRRAREWEVAHVLLPAVRLFLRPPRSRATDGTVLELTRLEQLYRVFERC